MSWDDGRKTEDLGKNFVSDLAIEKYKNMVSHDPKLAVDSCIVQLPTKKILRRVIELPESTEENLGNVVSYEMDRYTPFDKEDVYFDVKIKNRNKQEGKITVNLNVVKKKLLDDLIQFADASGIRIDSIFSSSSQDEEIEYYEFIKDEQRKTGQSKSSFFSKYLLLLIALLGLTALILPIAKNYWHAGHVSNQLQEMKEEVDYARQLQSDYKSVKGDVEFVLKRNSNAVKVLDFLNELTRIIPDDTSLTRLILEERVIQIRGDSSSASRLISLIDSSPDFIGVQFVAPVTQNSKTGKENFTIEFSLPQEE